jgi:hypothetical protein
MLQKNEIAGSPSPPPCENRKAGPAPLWSRENTNCGSRPTSLWRSKKAASLTLLRRSEIAVGRNKIAAPPRCEEAKKRALHNADENEKKGSTPL